MRVHYSTIILVNNKDVGNHKSISKYKIQEQVKTITINIKSNIIIHMKILKDDVEFRLYSVISVY